MRAINVQSITQPTIEQTGMEIVERKGQGHPDYLIDGASEAVSVELCKYCYKNFGVYLHHNVDKGLLVGGKSNPRFGGGEIIEPINIIVAGRAVTQIIADNKITCIPIGTIAIDAIKSFIKENLRFLDVDRNVICNYMIKAGSTDLIGNFDAKKDMPRANDTSFGVAYAPLSQTEKLVMETERHLNSKIVKKELPEVGEDIKVMGLRKNKQIDLTVAAPQISSLVPDMEHYLSVKEDVKEHVLKMADKITEYPVTVYVNMADMPEKGIVYLTVTGTSAEMGDDGNTGRGNRVHGLITPYRSMSLEATAGKNPINHVGKIYNVLATHMANTIYEKVNGVQEVYVKILSQIGKPIDQPQIADVQLILEKGIALNNVNAEVKEIVDSQLANIQQVSQEIIERKAMLF